jgi:hypothetical protein
MSVSQLQTLLEDAINVTFLAIVKIDWLGEQKSAKSQISPMKLNKLTELFFDRNGGFFPKKLMGMVPASLKSLYLDLNNQMNWSDVQVIFRMQQNLINLWLSKIQIDEFKSEPELNKLEELRLQDVTFNGQAFQNFMDFIKRQKDLKKVEMKVRADEILNGNSYTEVIKHILKQKTLKILSVTPGNLDHFIATLNTPMHPARFSAD